MVHPRPRVARVDAAFVSKARERERERRRVDANVDDETTRMK